MINEYTTTQEFNKSTSENFTAKIKQANLGSKRDIESFLKNQILILSKKKLNRNELNKLSKKVEAISTKEFTK